MQLIKFFEVAHENRLNGPVKRGPSPRNQNNTWRWLAQYAPERILAIFIRVPYAITSPIFFSDQNTLKKKKKKTPSGSLSCLSLFLSGSGARKGPECRV
ncbi:hypothetical protein ACOSP7_005685 [Xanthoceras sorbifolium]